jgi:hypothetical protein
MTTETLETINGHQKGRAVPPLPTYTFDTGITVGIRKLSPFLRDDIEAQIRKDDRRDGKVPTPPLAAGVEGVPEPNESDPDYLEARIAYEAALRPRIQERLLRIAITRGVAVAIDRDALDAYQADMHAAGIEVDEADEKVLYITRLCIGSNEDTQDLYNAIFTRAMPTREAVEAHKATFPRDVSGA